MHFLIFFVICISTLVTVNSYVLLAADMADFRSIARKFGPKNLADQIEDMVQDKGYNFGEDRDEQSDRTAEYTDDTQSQSQGVQSYEVKTERPNFSFQKAPSKTLHANQNRYNLKSAPAMEPLVAAAPLVAPAGLSLDDIVERVKQKLQAELLNRNAKAQADAQKLQGKNMQLVNGQVVNTPQQAPPLKISALRPNVYKNRIKQNVKLTEADSPAQDPIYETPVKVVKEEVQYETTYEEPDDKLDKPNAQYQGMDIESQPAVPDPTVGVTKKKVRYPSQQHAGVVKKVRYVKQVVVPAKPIQRQPKPQQVRQQPPKLIQQQRPRLAQNKVIKKKRLIRVSRQTTPQMSATVTNEAVGGVVAAPGTFEAVDLIKSNDSYEDYVTPPKEEAFESDGEDTAPTAPSPVLAYKYKVTSSAPTEPTFAIEMEPLAEDVEAVAEDEAVEYADETPETTTIEPKAKTESISFEEGETRADPNATTIAEVTEKGKATKKIKMGTMIPTREFYKQSSPNYYAKLPTIAEKYNFNEPIPEADRVPENLNPIGSPPASVNGKAILI